MMLGAVLNPINSSILAVALAPISLAFGAPETETIWLVTALYLSTAVGQPLVGRLIDIFGAKRLFLAGGLLVAIAGGIALVAPNIWVLVAARVLLGFGTCAGYPTAMHLIRSESMRTGMKSPAGVLTALAVSTQTVSVIGPTLGGLLITVDGWQATFVVNLPLGLASFVLGLIFIPRRTGLEPPRDQRPAVDGPGITFFVIGVLPLLVFLLNLHLGLYWLLGVTAVGIGLFVWRELRVRQPFIDLRVLSGNIPLLLTFFRTMLTTTVGYSFSYGYSQWLQDVRGLSPAVAGLIVLPTFAIGVAVAALTGRRAEVRVKLLIGSTAQILAGVLIVVMPDDAPIWILMLPTAVLGIPQGLNNLANQNALYFQADSSRIASSAGLQRTFMYFGAIAASIAIGLFYGDRPTTPGIHGLGLFVLCVAIVFLFISTLDRSLARVGQSSPEVPADIEAAELLDEAETDVAATEALEEERIREPHATEPDKSGDSR